MEKIYSEVDGRLLHIINRIGDIESGRREVVPENNYIQCAVLKKKKGDTFKPHKHIIKEKLEKEKIAQESWIVIKGKVRCVFFDINDEIIATPVLNPGDASFTLYGGHTYEILEDNTVVYEYKTGPYEGQILDKKFIHDPR